MSETNLSTWSDNLLLHFYDFVLCEIAKAQVDNREIAHIKVMQARVELELVKRGYELSLG